MSPEKKISLHENGVYMDGNGNIVTVVKCHRCKDFPWKNPNTGKYYSSDGNAFDECNNQSYNIIAQPY
jgi:hypothetical protein